MSQPSSSLPPVGRSPTQPTIAVGRGHVPPPSLLVTTIPVGRPHKQPNIAVGSGHVPPPSLLVTTVPLGAPTQTRQKTISVASGRFPTHAPMQQPVSERVNPSIHVTSGHAQLQAPNVPLGGGLTQQGPTISWLQRQRGR